MPHLSDAEIILLVLAAFYLFECFFRLDEGTVAFVAAPGRRFRLLRAAPFFASQRGGVLLSGIYPWSQTFLATSFPVSLDRDGAYSYTTSALSWRGRGLPECRYVRFADQPNFRAVDREVLAGEQVFLKLRSPQAAQSIAARLDVIAKTPAEQRGTCHRRPPDPAHRRRRGGRATGGFRAGAMPLALFGGVLLVGTFLIAPCLMWAFYDHPAAWKILISYVCFYLLVWGLAIAAFHKLHGTLEPDRTSDRLKQSLMMCVSPANTMRGLTAISTQLLVDFHPLAAAKALLAEDQFRAFARLVLRDARQPLRPIYPTDDAALVPVVDTYRASLEASLVALVERSGLDVEQLLAPPEPESPDVRAWCPRCEQQYAVASGRCDDCGGIELVPFAT